MTASSILSPQVFTLHLNKDAQTPPFMRVSLLSLAALYCLCSPLSAQDTFSICAVDSVTGEVGSAGASCIDGTQIPGGVVIISDVQNGIGVIHTQASWNSSNQSYANWLMFMGLLPQQILDSLTANDINNNPNIRQYGIVKLNGGSPLVAAYTGINCLNYKNHITGPHYSIQGNILLGQQILDSMEARFLSTQGDLACKLMAAMQGAKVIGADTRCTNSGNSSLSSFLRVACPNDPQGVFNLDLIVAQGPPGFEPIDSLQTLFNNAHNCSAPLQCPTALSEITHDNVFTAMVVPNPFSASAVIRISDDKKNSYGIELYDSRGGLVLKEALLMKNEYRIEKGKLIAGIYFYKVVSGSGRTVTGKFVIQ
jgi:uncharacterized Ntn-hydrolase superfamily protein